MTLLASDYSKRRGVENILRNSDFDITHYIVLKPFLQPENVAPSTDYNLRVQRVGKRDRLFIHLRIARTRDPDT